MFYGTYVAVKIIFITLFYLVGGRKNNILVSSVLSVIMYFICVSFRRACEFPGVGHRHTHAHNKRKARQCTIRTTSNKSHFMQRINFFK